MSDEGRGKPDEDTTETPRELEEIKLAPERLREDGSGLPERRWRNREEKPTSG